MACVLYGTLRRLQGKGNNLRIHQSDAEETPLERSRRGVGESLNDPETFQAFRLGSANYKSRFPWIW